MHFCYILYSEKIDRFYIGETAEITHRLALHNTGHFQGSYTKQTSDWKLALLIECENIGHAKRLEYFIKKMKSRVFIQKLINDDVLLTQIIDKHRKQNKQ